jgi:hypothetical protein
MDDPSTYNAGHAIGSIVTYVVLFGGILALGMFFGNRLARKRGVPFVRWPLGVAFALVLLLLAGQCSRPSQAAQAAPADGPGKLRR